ncbi:uncharacterized protein LOC130798229 [Amaranthus tricolor]|uniref:uncharacterized protein LOC130798229 n=1 Tax=Amaranthus tricolor TaxID=29722 RepID=UPI00258F9E1C|nr:uncharacterized protein LOC130798229 [Amaranthus tricolor]
MLFKWRKTLKSKPEFKPPSIDNETWARWKADWERPDNKVVSARNSSNRRGGKDRAEATHLGGSIPHARTMRDLEQSQGQRPTAYEIFTRTHGVFDNDTGDCSQWTNSKWTNSKSQKVNDEYRSLMEENPTRDPSKVWLDAIKNVESGSNKKYKKSKEVFGVGSASQIIYPPEPTEISSSQPAQPDYDAIIQQRFADLEARQMEFNNQLWEAIRRGNAQTAYEYHQRMTEQLAREREQFMKFLESIKVIIASDGIATDTWSLSCKVKQISLINARSVGDGRGGRPLVASPCQISPCQICIGDGILRRPLVASLLPFGRWKLSSPAYR